MNTVRPWLAQPSGPAALAAVLALAGVAVGFQMTYRPELLLVAGVAVAVVALAFFSLPAGLILLTFLIFFELVPGFGATNVTLVKLVGLLITVSWLARVVDVHAGIRLLLIDHRLFSFTVMAFVVWGCLSVGWADNASATTSLIVRLVLVAVLAFVTYSAISEPRYLYWVLWVFCIGACSTTLYGIFKNDYAMGRLEGGVVNPNELAAFLAPAFVIAMFLFAAFNGVLNRLALALIMVVCLTGIALTQTRGAMVGLVVALAFGLFVAGPVRPVIAALILIALACSIGFYLGLATPTERSRLTDLSAQGSSGRADEWRIALRMAEDHPVVGVGLGNFPTVEPQYIASSINLLRSDRVLQSPPAHNMYLQVLSELGVIGFALFLSILGGALVVGLRAIGTLARGPDRRLEIVGRGVVISYASLLTTNIFNNGLVHKQLWLFIGLLLALSALASPLRSDDASAQADPVDPADPDR
jgi:O-antigen ligase